MCYNIKNGGDMFQIAIDGFMGSGKSSLAKGLCKRLGDSFKMLDTGAIFRAFAYAYKATYGTEVDENKVKDLLSSKNVEVRFIDGVQNIFVNQENVTPYLRTEEISQLASKISVFACVREKYLVIAKDFASRNNCVMEGRDIGSVVMPDADVKIFLTADEKVRAQRRFEEEKLKNEKVTYAQVLKDLRERDKRDSTRSIAPLKPLDDSVIVDNTDMNLEETIDFCYKLVEKRMGKKKYISIAIDGFVCSGKSTIAKELARQLGYHVFDTGAVYRGIACAFKYLHYDTNLISEKYIKNFADQIYVDIKFVNGLQHVIVNGVDHTQHLRTEEISVLSAKISPYVAIRDKVLKIQRRFAAENNTVMEGRDIGSEVLPDADFKFFINADEKVRAMRRYEQQKAIGNDVDFNKILEDLRDRDYKDIHREHGAIRQMPDAYLVDTTNQTLEESVKYCLNIINSKTK